MKLLDKQKMLRHAVRNKLLLSYFVIGSVLLLIFSAIIMNTSFKTALFENSSELDGLLEQNYLTAENIIENLTNSITDSTITESSIIMALYGDNFEEFNMFDIHSTLLEMSNTNTIIDSIYIYNSFEDMVFSSLSSMRRSDEFYEPGIREIVETGLSGEGKRLIPRYSALDSFSNNFADQRWITMILTQANDQSGSAVLINISQKALQDLIFKKNDSTPDFLESFIIRTDGIIISHEDRELFGRDASDLPYIRKILESSEPQGEFKTEIDSGRVTVRYIASQSLDCIFITITSYDELVRSARGSMMWILLITILFLALGFAGSLFFTRFIYSPLGRLVEVAETGLRENPELTGGSEYEIVTSFINYMDLRLSEAWRRINDNIPEKKRNILRKLLQGRFPGEIIPDYWKDEFGIDLSGPCYATVILRQDSIIDLDSEFSDFMVIQQQQSENIDYILKETSEFFHLEIVDMEPGQLVAVLNITENRENDYPEHVESMARKITERFKEKYAQDIQFFAGPVVESIDEIHSAYNRTVELSRYRLVYPEAFFLDSKTIEQNTNSAYEYPQDIEQKLIKAVNLGSEDEITHALSGFSSKIREFRHSEIILSLTQLVLILSRSANAAMEHSIQERWIQISADLRKSSNTTLNEVIDWIDGICREIISNSKVVSETRHNSLVEKVKQIILEDYGDSSLCAASIAEGVGFSTNYLRQIFKKNTGESLSDYISHIRFDRAKELLTTTNLTTKKIAEICGFYNGDYFYYAFRKMTGKTPGNYRKTHIS